MPQLGLLFILVAVPMMLLSGANIPIQSTPLPLQYIMQLALRRISWHLPSLSCCGALASTWSGRASLPYSEWRCCFLRFRCTVSDVSQQQALPDPSRIAAGRRAAVRPRTPSTTGHTCAAFARVPYDPSSRQAVVAIALQEEQLVGARPARKLSASDAPEENQDYIRSCSSASAKFWQRQTRPCGQTPNPPCCGQRPSVTGRGA